MGPVLNTTEYDMYTYSSRNSVSLYYTEIDIQLGMRTTNKAKNVFFFKLTKIVNAHGKG